MLTDAFSVENMLIPDNFKSLLYYFGLLTIQGTERGAAVLTIPNHTVREQMYSYLTESLADADVFRIYIYELAGLIQKMAYDGQWQPVFTYLASEQEKQSRVREFIDGEAHIKGFLLAFLAYGYAIRLPGRGKIYET